MTLVLKLSWSRPENVPYPVTWSTFRAKDFDSDELVEYEIRDVTPDKFEEVFHLMSTDYMLNEPLNQYFGTVKEDGVLDRFKSMCSAALKQKTPIACFKKVTDEIVGANMVVVYSKVDNMDEQFKNLPKADGERKLYDSLGHLYKDFDVYQHYGVDKYLSCVGLSVSEKYRGRGIGLRLLQARKEMGKTFGIKIAHSDFSSNFSNPLAEKCGFVVDRELTYAQLNKINPKFDYVNMKHDRLTSMTWVFDN